MISRPEREMTAKWVVAQFEKRAVILSEAKDL
jgi:hypothetical protein